MKNRDETGRNLKRRYGMTYEDYTKLLDAQNGLCGLCGKLTTEMYVDHNHTTKKVRGLLCSRCNLRLGIIEIPGFLDRALAYLKNTQ